MTNKSTARPPTNSVENERERESIISQAVTLNSFSATHLSYSSVALSFFVAFPLRCPVARKRTGGGRKGK